MPSSGLPTITRAVDVIHNLKTWQTKLNTLLKTVPTPKAPWNFAATSARGGILLSWAPVNGVGVDGYQLLRSATADFSVVEATINLPGQQQNAYFDAINTNKNNPTVKKFYKLRATAGTQSNPQSVQGVLTGIVSQTCLATNDTTSNPTTVLDTTTTDKTQTAANRGLRVTYNFPVLRT